ncbi:sigma 54-interacting transcriptional regulator [Oceanobacillus neutriphilus]|uniref:Sigma L-dependent transcriptional regulator YqiR n=1 Tax=Oceanobacillus neutriphilus TaxID=531815 RepID=A0ABQ2NYP6_9BACI|nr:sigma 54-interacting transcriptional regulator [Oceanobacillus neutriphilus]GGP13750.1 putative sigma L-dependent transcriptional regulator YqiR [Oceanobacillus neutriphilus]
MKQILIVGAGKGGTALFRLFKETKRMKICAIVDKDPNAPAMKLAEEMNIHTSTEWKEWIHHNIDIVVNVTGEEDVFEKMIELFPRKTIIIPGSVANIIYELIHEKTTLTNEVKVQANRLELILNHMNDGMIVVNKDEQVQLLNRRAEQILGKKERDYKGKHIKELLKTSRLSHVLRSQRKELNQKTILDNGKKVIASRIPIINKTGDLVGAFAVFKDITEVVQLAEENTDLNEIKTMLEAIIKSSDEAISVVDENGNGLIINPAYTRLTGLTEEEVIGKPATVDISEGDSVHLKVLKTRRAVRGVHMKVGPARKDVIVNVAPVIVQGKMKGSVGVLHDVSELQSVTKELKRARQIIRNLEARYTFDDIIGHSPEMKLALEQAKVGAKTPAIVLLRGETGTGKELFAHAIHHESDRKYNKFLRVNCSALSESMLEKELFGSADEKLANRKGLFEQANNGSIFLDEIGNLSLAIQEKLLHVLKENKVVPVGATKPVPVDVRVIAGTNINLEKAVMNKHFREDLYYQINKLPISIPSLKERKEDIPMLVEHIIYQLNEEYGKNVQGISDEALDKLMQYHWPGNIREMANVISHSMIFIGNTEEQIEASHLPELQTKQSTFSEGNVQTEEPLKLQEALDRYEKMYLQEVYQQCNKNKTKTAKVLQISVRNLYYKLEKYQIE